MNQVTQENTASAERSAKRCRFRISGAGQPDIFMDKFGIESGIE